MKVWYLVFQPDSLTYTLAKSLSHGGHSIWVWVVDPEYGAKRQNKIQKRVTEIPNVQILKADEINLPPTIERLIVQTFPRPMESLKQVDPVARRARHISLVTAGDRSREWWDAIKLQWAEAKVFLSYMDRIDGVLYKDGYYRVDLYSLIKSRRMIGFDVHSQFLHDEGAFRVIHARDWKPESTRPILANFLGSQDPEARKRVLDTVRPLFQTANGDLPAAARKKTMYWHEYSDADPSGIEPGKFVDVLTHSDFTLCPRGYSLVTHRPMEAMLRGSIPVLSADELDLYDMELEDGVNCVGVPKGRWAHTIQRLACMEERDIVAMRRNIDGMLNYRLNYDAASARMRARFGVPPPAELGF